MAKENGSKSANGSKALVGETSVSRFIRANGGLKTTGDWTTMFGAIAEDFAAKRIQRQDSQVYCELNKGVERMVRVELEWQKLQMRLNESSASKAGRAVKVERRPILLG